MGSQFSSKCNPGDLIEISRPIYQHWAIYMGDGYVVHLTSTGDYPEAGSFSICASIGSSVGSVLCKTGVVKMELLTHVARGCKYRVNNWLDKELKPQPVEQILSSAKRMVGEMLPYDIIKNNCEHFVTKLRYGEPICQQVKKVEIAAEVAGAFGILALAADNFAQYLMRNWPHHSDSLKKPQDPALETAEQPTTPTSTASLTPALREPTDWSLILRLPKQRMQ
ncbi:hypothetical protein HJG60_016067 [Phyllostomus discolor]|uniref:LRAT domain-containing protein n=1 Tax=Phyllostomus discolor TaxID=89673 RepID=A0A834AAJ4_9CHIR|nr:hypothetical protein HJG60_016067 [Phyllostomus discolor]